MRKLLSIFIIFVILINTAGCSEEWRKKFIRKKKEVAKKPRIWQEKRYPNAPTEAMYDKHYNYTISWLSELASDLGQNNKKDLRCIEEALSQAQDMQNCLIPDKAKELDKHINRLVEIRDIIKREDLGHANKDYVRSSIEREERFLRREFYYHKIQNFMKKSFNEHEQPADTDETQGA